MRLDLGCGCNPTGDVNVDHFVKDIGHRTGKAGVFGGDVPTGVGRFVDWDLNVLPLPFGSGSFSEVFCSHAIEHVDDPFGLLAEMVRVSSFKVVVVCPHRLGERATLRRNPFHRWFFGVGWFHRAAKRLGCSCRVRVSGYRFLPCEFFCLFRLPYELTVELVKC